MVKMGVKVRVDTWLPLTAREKLPYCGCWHSLLTSQMLPGLDSTTGRSVGVHRCYSTCIYHAVIHTDSQLIS